MTTPCQATTKTGAPCKRLPSRWPRGMDGNPYLCGSHLPAELRDIRDAAFADEERRLKELLDDRLPACWSWNPELPVDRIAEEYDAPSVAFDDFMRRLREGDEGALHRAFFFWHADRCAVCGFRDTRLVKDHDHDTGLIRGLLCRSCNGLEPHDGGLFRRYREKPPAEILSIRLVYVDPIYGPAEPSSPRRRQLDNHPAYALASRLAERLQPEGE